MRDCLPQGSVLDTSLIRATCCCVLAQMPQLVGIPHHIDCGDLSVLDFERGCLKFTVGLQRYKAGQSVDKTGTNKLPSYSSGNDPPEIRGLS